MSIGHSHVFGFTPRSVVRPQTRKSLEVARNRLILKASLLIFALVAIAGRLITLVLCSQTSDTSSLMAHKIPGSGRAEIVDVNGEPLASTIITASLMANAQKIDNHAETAQLLSQALPHLKKEWIQEKLSTKKTFIWLGRHLTPQQQAAVLRLGIPGLELLPDEKRIYTHGSLLAHTVGMVNVDNEGIAGIELSFNKELNANKGPIQLSLDVRTQEIAHNVLSAGIQKFRADAGNVMVIHIPTGEIRAMVSLPDFNPNHPECDNTKSMFNRNIVGVYEMGSTMKILNHAMSLDCGAVNFKNRYDTSEPVAVGRFRITDFKGTKSWLTVPQVFVRSSNIGASRMAIAAGIQKQKAFFEKMGLLSPASLEVVEKGYPIYPRHWTEPSLITISYGYGVAITPLHLIKVVGSILNNGRMMRPTLLKGKNANYQGEQMISPQLSRQMRALMHLTAVEGTARLANSKQYFVLGKTGTADRRSGKGYQKEFVDTCFVGAIGSDIDHIEYIVLVMLENPKRLKETYGYNNGGWNSAPVAGEIMRRLAILYGLAPNREVLSSPFENNIMQLVSYTPTGSVHAGGHD